MTNRETMELFIEKNGQETVAYPFVEKDHVVFGNGMGIEDVIEQDVTMPTVTHEEVSFKVGVGDQDVSSSIVDSSVGEMVIKGKTYHNILPEPSTHVLTNSKEMFKVDEGLDSIVEVVDGVAKSAILKGQTLVNLVPNKTLTVNGGESTWRGYGDLSHPLTLTSKYFIKANIVENTIDHNNGIHMLLRQLKSGGGTQYVPIMNLINNGYMIVTIDRDKPNIDNITFYANSNATTGIFTIKDLMIIEYQEGMENWDLPYFEGMQSVKLPVLTTTGKNLYPFGDVSFTSSYTSWHDTLGMNNMYGSYVPKSKAKFMLKAGTYTISYGESNNFRTLQLITIDERVIITGAGSFKLTDDTWVVLRGVVSTPNEISSLKNIQLEEGSTATSYEPYKSNILTVNDDVTLRGIGDVRDTLDCLTGEVVERIGEVVLDGSENWNTGRWFNQTNGIGFEVKIKNDVNPSVFVKAISDKLLYDTSNNFQNDGEYFDMVGAGNGETWIRIRVLRSKLVTQDVSGFKQWLSQNPTTVQYQLATESIKTVDLSSSGNWEKIVLNGSENWTVYNRDSTRTFTKTSAYQMTIGHNVNWTFENLCVFGDNGFEGVNVYSNDKEGMFIKARSLRLGIKKSKLLTDDVAGFKQYLQQNPITVWYQTQTHQDSTQVKQPIFFKDGHIIQSSGVDNSLIPTLDYQAKTSNSYVMDLMKTNTRYTMKAKSASGTFTIDGTSYGAGTNGTFTTPSSMTNKLLVMSDKTHEEVMIIEGDVTDKTIPYFKGIKSAFEGEDKIEVLSTGKNLFDGAFEKGMIDVNGNLGYTPTAIRTVNYISVKPNASYHINLLNLEPFESARVVYVHEYDENFKVLGETQVDNRNIYTSKSATKFIKINTHNVHDLPVDSKMIVCENSTLDKQYEPYKSNICKIPLLSPLRSLPNGVCDELIIDRMKKKATLIQRVGHSVINSEFAKNGGNWGYTKDTDPCWGFHCGNYVQGSFNLNEHNSINDKLPIKEMATTGDPLMGYHESNPHIAVRRLEVCNLTMAKEWLDRNPIDFYYQLATPVVTEIDLEGFPYIYKDGHIFLNSEIAPTTQIIYSISQQHQISASTQDLIRHEQELVYLYKLIAQYIQVDYQSTLLSLDLKLK